MKIIIAPDSFKGSLSALEAGNAMKEGMLRVIPEANIEVVPMADGGEGTVDALVASTGGKIVMEEVSDPLMRKIKAKYGILGDGMTAVIEMSAASGLPLVSPEERNPMITTTYGTGELIKSALNRGCKKLIIGIGGSATVDGGAGVAQALGAKLLDRYGNDIAFGGGGLEFLDRIDISGIDQRIYEIETIVACDVDNPLVGPRGGPQVYGPQKGATPEMVNKLDEYLNGYAEIIKRDLNIDVKDVPGAGAAGGLGAGLIAFMKAKLRSGIEIVIQASGLKDRLKDADLVITGEGKIDRQTIYGKTPIGVAKTAKMYGLPVIAICGIIGEGAFVVYDNGIDALMSIISYPMTVEEAMDNAFKLISDAAERTIRLVLISRSGF